MQSQLRARRASIAASFIAMLALTSIAACGGGGGGGGPAPLPAPSGLSFANPDTFVVGTAIAPLAPSVTGTVTSYSVSPSLPAGLSLSTTSGTISGTPTATSAATTYTVSAANASGSTTFGLSITVNPAAPTALGYASPTLVAQSLPMSPLTPSVTGTVTSYTVTPALPAGLSLDAATGTISGTPTVVTAAASYHVTASNVTGQTSFDLNLAVVTVTSAPATARRIVARGTPVTISMDVTPVGFSFPAGLSAKATDAAGVFSPTVVVTPTAGGASIVLATLPSAATGHVSEDVTLSLCLDAGCMQPFVVPAVAISVDVLVMDSNSAWPGDHLTTLAAWPGIPEWSTFQGNPAHSGYVPVALDPNAITTRWQAPAVTLTDSWYQNLVHPTTLNGMVYVSGVTGTAPTLYARDEATGTTRWTYDFSGLPFPSVNPPGTGNGAVYVAAGQQSSTYMFGFDATTGNLLFKSAMSSQWEHYLAPTVGASGIYTNAGTYGGLYAFDPTGTQLFFDAEAQTSDWTPAVDANGVYAYTGSLTVADPVTGAVTQTIVDPTFTNYVYSIGGSVVLGAPGSVIVANYADATVGSTGGGNYLLDFNLPLNAVTWKVPGKFASTPAYANGVIYATNLSPMGLEARSETDGSLLWRWVPPQAGDTSFVSEVLLTKTMVFVSTNLALYGVDVTTHQLVFSYPIPGRLALSPNGILYVSSSALPLTAFNAR